MCINKKPFLWIVLFLLMAQLSCSSNSEISRQKPTLKDEVLAYMKSGFAYSTPRLFIDEMQNDEFSRIEVLLDYLGYGNFDWGNWFDVSVSGDGRYIRFESQGSRGRFLILGKDVKPKVYDFSEDPNNLPLALDNNNKPVGWLEIEHNPKRYFYNFSSVGKITFPTLDSRYDNYPEFDNAGEYFCCWDKDNSDVQMQNKEIRLYIYSVNNPTKPLIKSGLSSTPEKIFTTAGRVYLVGRNNEKYPEGISYEEYKREKDSLVLCRKFKVDCPWKLGARWLYPVDMDENARIILLQLEREMFFHSEYYLLNMDSLKLSKLPDIQKYPHFNRLCFLDPNIFTDIIEGAKPK